MITSALLTLFYGLIYALLSPLRALPDVSINTDIGSAIASASGYLSSIDFILPVATIVAVVGLFLTIEGSILVYKGINWLIRKIPGIN
jgi:hypothetical protein